MRYKGVYINKKRAGYFNFCKYLRKMGKEYSQLNFIYDWSIIFFVMLLVFVLVAGIVRTRKILHKKEVVLLVLMTVLFDVNGVLFFLELMGIIYGYFFYFLPFVFCGLIGICCGYLIKYQEEAVKMGRKKIFIRTSSKEMFVMTGLVISLGVFLVILIHVF